VVIDLNRRPVEIDPDGGEHDEQRQWIGKFAGKKQPHQDAGARKDKPYGKKYPDPLLSLETLLIHSVPGLQSRRWRSDRPGCSDSRHVIFKLAAPAKRAVNTLPTVNASFTKRLFTG
jgi:hypothetical protein